MKQVIFIHQKKAHLKDKKKYWVITYTYTQIFLSVLMLVSDAAAICLILKLHF